MKKSTAIVLIAFALLTIGFIVGAHPLVDHFAQTAQSGVGTFGSQWIHTDTSGTRYGLWGQSNSTTGRGVFASTTTFTGDTRGLQGRSASANGLGVFGYNDCIGDSVTCDGVGVYGYNVSTSGTGEAIHAFNNAPNGWAGWFDSEGNGVRIRSEVGKTGLVVIDGTKSAAVRTSSGDRLLYNEEATEVWFADYGIGVLRNGVATVNIEETFAETVNLEEPYHVFLQAYGDAIIYVGKRTPTSFEVVAREGTLATDIEFAYRIVAKRKGFETHRLEFAPWVSEDTPYSVMPTPPPPDPTPIPETETLQRTVP